MSTQWPWRVSFRIEPSDLAAGNTMMHDAVEWVQSNYPDDPMAQLDPDEQLSSFELPFSPTGTVPITHYCISLVTTEPFWQALLLQLPNIPSAYILREINDAPALLIERRVPPGDLAAVDPPLPWSFSATFEEFAVLPLEEW